MCSFDTKVTTDERERAVVARLKSREKTLLNAWRVAVKDKRSVQSFPSGGGEVKGAGTLGLFHSEVQGWVLRSRKRLRWELASFWLFCNLIIPHCYSWKI